MTVVQQANTFKAGQAVTIFIQGSAAAERSEAAVPGIGVEHRMHGSGAWSYELGSVVAVRGEVP